VGRFPANISPPETVKVTPIEQATMKIKAIKPITIALSGDRFCASNVIVFVLCHLSFVTRHSSFVIRHLSFALINHSDRVGLRDSKRQRVEGSNAECLLLLEPREESLFYPSNLKA
jgi:hypothetical protein